MNPQQLQEANTVASLIVGYMNNELTDIQKKELDEWLLASNDNMLLFDRLTDENNIEESVKWFHAIDEEIALHKVKAKIESAKKAWKKYGPWLAAASILIAFGYVFYTYEKKAAENNTSEVKIADNPVQSNLKNAVLITASGENIQLGSETENSIKLDSNIIALDKAGQLIYDRQLQSTINTIKVPTGGQYQVVLSDGSKVWLNTMTELKFPTSFNESTRVVELQGEGYFEIKKDAGKPFFVKSTKGTIQVTGTSFNVISYENDSTSKITLLEGGLKLISKKDSSVVRPEQEAIILSDGNIHVQKNPAAAESISWTKGLFSFHKASIEEVMNQLIRWYDVQVKYEKLPPKQFTGNIPMKSTLQTALSMLELSGDVHFTLSENTITVRP